MRPTVDVTRIITEEDTTKGSKGTQHVCLESHRRLDAIDIVGRCEHRTTGHLEMMTLWMWKKCLSESVCTGGGDPKGDEAMKAGK